MNKTELFISRANKIHKDKYIYTKSEYKNCDTKVCIICPIHGEFWQTPYHHINRKQGCSKCAKRVVNFSAVLDLVKEKYNDKYDYSLIDLDTENSIIPVICHEKDCDGNEHGVFYVRVSDHVNRKRGCPKCVKNKSMTHEDFIKKAIKIHGDRYFYNENYKKSSIPISMTCKKCGYTFSMTPNNHLRGQRCPKCYGTHLKNYKNFENDAKKVHGDKYIYHQDYKNAKTKIKITCKEHGDFYMTPNNHLRGEGCPKCPINKNPKLEKLINHILSTNNIKFETQKKFDWLKYKHRLSLDFYLHEHNIAIECQGIQHFKAIEYFGGEKAFSSSQERDSIKKQLCEEHGIKLLYFTDYKDIECSDILFKDSDSLLEEIKSTSN